LTHGPDGTTSQFSALYAELQPSLWRYVHRMIGDADAADDIVQETFVRLLAHPELSPDEARRWIFPVATNLVRDRGRSAVRRQRLLAASPMPEDTPAVADRRLEREEQVAAVRAALQQLAERDQQLLLMREEGFRYQEIADAVGVAPGSVGTLIARAVRRFTEVYKPIVE
jgi:RNA polymerase sigma-70 factor (ECF subfamily)